MATVNQFKEAITKIFNVEFKNKKVPKYVAAIITQVNSDQTVNCIIPPDYNQVLSGILNKTGVVLHEGDSVELCAKDGSLSNCWVTIKHGIDESASAPYIGDNGNWFVDGKDTGVKAQGPKGDRGESGSRGSQGEKGDPGIVGTFTSAATYSESACKDYSSRAGTVSWGDGDIVEDKGNKWQKGNRIILIINCTNGDVYTSYQIVYDRNNLTPESYWINKKGDKGDRGEKGDIGPRGPQGPAGGFDVNKVYPVGAIYMSTVSTDPGSLFGGTWARIQGGFLYGAASGWGTGNGSGTSTNSGGGGNTGGHTLTVAEMPSHTHTQNKHKHTGLRWFDDGGNSISLSAYSGNRWGYYTGTNSGNVNDKSIITQYTTATNQNTGGGGSHTHPQTAHTHAIPYIAVFMWRRTS